MSEKSAFYAKLKNQLDDTSSFPSDYLYKFIVPSTKNQVAEVEALFAGTGAVLRTNKSKTGKYISVSILLKVYSSDKVIEYYKKAEKIEGIISL